MNYLARTALCLCAGIALLAPSAATAARKAKELLQYIPADTPYVMAITKPMPEELQERFEPAVDKMLAAYRRILRLHLDDELARLSAQEGGEEEAARLASFAEEVLALMSVEALRNAGFDRDTLLAVYGDGLLPVVRLALSDIDAFSATLTRLEEKSGEHFSTGEVAGKAYRYRDFGELRLVIATAGKDAVLTAVPTNYSDKRLASALGFDKPRRSLAKTKELRAIAREYDFTDHLVGFVDVERIVAALTGDPGGANAELFQLAGYDASGITPICREEFAAVAQIAPRTVVGYTEVNSKYLDTRMIVEFRDDIATGMSTLAAAVPGLGTDPGGLFSIGFSLDPMALRNFVEARLDAMEADPYACPALAELQASTVAGREALQKPLPPMVYGFRGFLASITDIKGLDFAAGTPPEAIDGGVVLAMENIETLISSAAMMSPEVAAVNLLPDGKARLLDLPQLAELAEQAYAALSVGALAIGIGTGGDKVAETMLVAAPGASRPVFTTSVDARRYYEVIAKAVMEGEPEEDGEPMPLEMREALRDTITASAEMYDRMTVNVHLTKRGVEVGSRIKLAK